MKKIVYMSSLFVLLAGCGQTDEKYTSFPKEQDERVAQIEQVLDEHQEIEHANIVVIKQQILVAIQVKPWQRWQKKKVEDAVKKQVEKKFQQEDVTVSADFKLHWEAGKLMEKKSEDKLKDAVKTLADLAKEEM